MGGNAEARSKSTPQEAEKSELQNDIERFSFFRLLQKWIYDEKAEEKDIFGDPIPETLFTKESIREVRKAVEESKAYKKAKRDARQLRRWNLSFKVVGPEGKEPERPRYVVLFSLSK